MISNRLNEWFVRRLCSNRPDIKVSFLESYHQVPGGISNQYHTGEASLPYHRKLRGTEKLPVNKISVGVRPNCACLWKHPDFIPVSMSLSIFHIRLRITLEDVGKGRR